MKKAKLYGIIIVVFLFSMQFSIAAEQDQLLLNVPFKAQSPPGNWQNNMNCGPASALMVGSYHKDEIATTQDLKDLIDWLYARNYISPQNGAEYYDGNTTNTTILAQILHNYYEYDVVVERGDSSLIHLKQDLQKGLPVIVAVNIAMDPSKMGHFMVIVGMRDDSVMVHDPGKSVGSSNFYSQDAFLTSWATSNYSKVMLQREVVTWHPDGSLVKLEGNSDVYQIIDGEIHVVTNENVFNNHDFRWDHILTVNRLELACYDLGFEIDWQPYRETFKIDNDYFLMERRTRDAENCSIYEIASEFAYDSWTFDFPATVLSEQQAEDRYFSKCDLQARLYIREGTVVKPDFEMSGFSSEVVFVAMPRGRLRPIEDPEVFEKMGYGNLPIHRVRRDQFEGSFAIIGPTITDAMMYQCQNGSYHIGSSVDENDMDADHDGYSVYQGDCDDADPEMNPGESESCNGLDDNCNNQTDEGTLCSSGFICSGLSGCVPDQVFGDEDVIEEEEELEDQDPCQGQEFCVTCVDGSNCADTAFCIEDRSVWFSGSCTVLGICYREITHCENGCKNDECIPNERSDEDLVEEEIPFEIESEDNIPAEEAREQDSPLEEESEEDLSEVVSEEVDDTETLDNSEIAESRENLGDIECSVVCPADMMGYAWYGSDFERSGQVVSIDATVDEICQRGRPWLDFNCACKYPYLWACHDWTRATVTCNHEFYTREDEGGRGEIWLTDFACH